MKIAPTLIKLGVFTTITAFAGLFVALIAGDLRFGDTKSYAAQFTSASGITSGSDVKVAGVTRGKIKDVTLSGDGTARVKFSLDSDVVLTGDTRAAILYKNLIGDRYMELSEGQGRTVALSGNTTPALDLDEVVNGFRPLLQGLDPDQANQLTGSLVEVLNGRESSVAQLIADLALLTNSIADRDESIGAIITNFNNVLSDVSKRTDQLNSLLTGVGDLTKSLSDDRQTITTSLDKIDGLTRSLHDLTGPARNDIASAVTGLRKLTGNLDRNTDTVNLVLGGLPEAYRLIGRVAGYGNFVNFFVCGLAIRYGSSTQETTPMITVPAARCQP
jgi:phospholipid/cholesterol/gamma-HCH transport system substrate-binding protein